MSQHDFSIANQGFPAFRADLNAALVALASLSSGATAPSPATQYQLWLDTSASPLTLKFFDGSDWIALVQVNTSTNQAVPVIAADGLSGDVVHGGVISNFASTGIDDNATALRLTLSDSEAVLNDSGAAFDTRIEGDTDANLLVVKGATDKVGIGTNAPSDKLQVVGAVRGQSFSSYTFTLADNTATSIDFGQYTTAMCIITSHYTDVCKGTFFFRVGGVPYADTPTGMVGTLGTGTLSGATGVDGQFTIRAHTDYKLYFENRVGSSVGFTVTIVSRHV